MLIKPAEGVSYVAILKDFKKRVKPEELGVTVQGIRETRSKDLLVELKCYKEGRGWLDTALNEVHGVSGIVRHLIPRIEVEIADIEPRIEAEDVEDAIRGFFDHVSELELKVSLTKRPYKAYISSLCTKGGMIAIVTSAKCTRPSIAKAVFTRVISPPCRSRYTRRFVSKLVEKDALRASA